MTGAFLSGTTVYYKSNATGSFVLVNSMTDAGSGPASTTFPGMTAAGWTNANQVDDLIRKYAGQSQAAGTTRVFVATPVGDDTVIAGFYSLHLGSLERARASPSAAQRAPDPVPALVMGRLAVASTFAGQGLGAALLRDALERALLVARHAGVKIFLVHAKDRRAKSFYVHFGFEPSPVDDLTLMLLVQDIPVEPDAPA